VEVGGLLEAVPNVEFKNDNGYINCEYIVVERKVPCGMAPKADFTLGFIMSTTPRADMAGICDRDVRP
jgi:hypothetical protein